MTDIRQAVAAFASEPSVTWRADTVLDTPKLLFPADETRYCPQLLLWTGASADVTLSWGAVSGASFYVIQTCDASSFSGPTVRGIRTASTSATLTYIDEVSQDRKLYWRVAAYNAAGAASLLSAPRSLQLTCPGILGTGYDPDDTPGTDTSDCDYYGVDLVLTGPDQIRLSDSGRTFPLNINHDCNTESGNAITVLSVAWTLTQANADITITEQLNTHLQVECSATEEQAFDIKATVTFQIYDGGQFDCEVTKKVLVEGEAVGGGGDIIHFKILSVSPAIGMNATGCDFVQGEVTQISCTGSSVRIGDEVRIWDPVYCYFNMPIELLVGLHGVAHKMDNPIDPYDADLLTDCQYEVVAAGACRWIVSSLCCSEEYEL
tara:strand:+ start:9529 stop:10659 length:1131 start_codon:yes stop_codon:yes gene_type:complete